jgi:hypothetical protein
MMHVTTVLVANCSYERLSKSHLPRIYHAITEHWKELSKVFFFNNILYLTFISFH